VQQEECEKCARLGAPERDDLAVPNDFERPQHTKLEVLLRRLTDDASTLPVRASRAI
jgi:hypothetical protein